ncbi:hypothetical protein TRFO_05730 [Tritrichomonas foetus]|uniref:Uncharacterized protein n=1 Tax=Tritrichomonas foetus TaxID=1144522 RepID=A0A1J4K3V9_9EUKA|nr:hypothetical protein TRFO_05730 [Tritrichomonas foetus]|eukprot:OHT06071.1 hypothetical protein TRFO_05730 [Tritrichomonas foetus]
MIIYKDCQTHRIDQSLFIEHDQNIISNLKLEIEKIIRSKSYPSKEELELLNKYVNDVSLDDMGINKYFFSLTFQNQDLLYAELFGDVFQNIYGLNSFNIDDFIDVEPINIISSHIIQHNILSVKAIQFMRYLLVKTHKRLFLKQSHFFTMLESLGESDLQKVILAFFSESEEIDQEMYDKTSPYLNHILLSHNFKNNDSYSYLLMILSHLTNGIIIDGLEDIIRKFLQSFDNMAILEIVVYLIDYSQHFNEYIPDLFHLFTIDKINDSVIKAIIKVFNSKWAFLEYEHKQAISNIFQELIDNSSYKIVGECLNLICMHREWKFFGHHAFLFKTIDMLTNYSDQTDYLELIFSFLDSDTVDDNIKIEIVQYLIHKEDVLHEIAEMENTSASDYAKLLLDCINDDT